MKVIGEVVNGGSKILKREGSRAKPVCGGDKSFWWGFFFLSVQTAPSLASIATEKAGGHGEGWWSLGAVRPTTLFN